MKQQLLLVDDDIEILATLCRVLAHQPYQIFTAENAAQALDIIHQHSIHVVVSDLRMPKINGDDFLKKVSEISPDTVRIMLSAHYDSSSLLTSINKGHIYKFITKPWQNEELIADIHAAFQSFHQSQLQKTEKQLHSNDNEYNTTLLFEQLNSMSNLNEKLYYLHQVIQKQRPYITRIAVATYDQSMDQVATLAASPLDTSPLTHYCVSLNNAPSLRKMAKTRRGRVIQDSDCMANTKAHNQLSKAYAASYTLPFFHGQQLQGFIFFNANEKNCFNETLIQLLETFATIIQSQVLTEINKNQFLSSSLQTVLELAHLRDPETGSHLDRIEQYSKILAFALADEYHLSDVTVNQLAFYARLHDIGKVGIHDKVLLKPGRLNDEEFAQMQLHTILGLDIIKKITAAYASNDITAVDMLHNIVYCHHEDWDGGGYPQGLAGEEIPVEARIVAVCDVFDALCSERPYKKAWSTEQAFAHLEQLANKKFDPRCVKAFVDNKKSLLTVYERFSTP